MIYSSTRISFIMRLLIALLIFTKCSLYAQEYNCGSQERLNYYLESNTKKKIERKEIEERIRKNIKEHNTNTIIPVVFHIVYKNPYENISDNQIYEQLDVLNKDFTRTNTDASNTPTDFIPIAANMEINFCLAQQTPNGLPTNGIIRKQTNNNFFPLYGDAIFYDSLGGSSAWDTKKYLNIWVCDIEDGILGWAQFPSGGDVNTDGVVINFEHFGKTGTAIYPYNLGRTTTHEVGHWLNLYHIWGDTNCGDDWVNDTPEQEQANFGCKIHPHQSCNNNGDMFMNYMDYTNDACMNSFTLGQKNRVWTGIYNYRIDLLSSNGCNPITIPNSDAGISKIIEPDFSDCANPIYPKVVLKNYGGNILNSVSIEYSVNGSNIYTNSWNGSLSPLETDTIILSGIMSSGTTQLLIANTILPNGSADINPSNDQQQLIFSSINGELININIMTDNYGNENSWKLLNENNIVIDSNDSLLNNTLYELSYCLEYSCYKFIINDSYGDGFCCNFGNGYYELYEHTSTTPIAFVQNFSFTDTTYFCLGANSVNEEEKNLEIYPNPTDGKLYINNNLESKNPFIFARIFNMLGQEVLHTEIKDKEINLNILKEGLYQLIIYNKEKHYHHKIILKK